MTARPLWRCPECGRRFANKNQWHGCGPYSVEGFLAGKGERARLLFETASCAPGFASPTGGRARPGVAGRRAPGNSCLRPDSRGL